MLVQVCCSRSSLGQLKLQLCSVQREESDGNCHLTARAKIGNKVSPIS